MILKRSLLIICILMIFTNSYSNRLTFGFQSIEHEDKIIFKDKYLSEITKSTVFFMNSVSDHIKSWHNNSAYNPFQNSEINNPFIFTISVKPKTSPKLLSPANGKTVQENSPNLIWEKVSNEGYYSVQISQSENFSNIYWFENTYDTKQQISIKLEEGTKWYWRVRFINSFVNEWSNIFSFTITEGKPIPRAYYVDATNGRDEYNGRTKDKPWKTISKVNAKTLIPGDTIKLNSESTFTGTTLYANHSGTATNPIIYTSYGRSQATIKPSQNSDGIHLTNAEYITIKNLKIIGPYNPFNQVSGEEFSNGGINIDNVQKGQKQGICIDSCNISKINGYGIIFHSYNSDSSIKGGYNDITISNCRIDSIGKIGIHFVYSKSPLSTYNELGAFRNTNIIIRNCKISRVTGWKYVPKYSAAGIFLSDCDTVIIEYCTIWDCGTETTITGGDGVEVVRSNNVLVQYCEVYGQTSPLHDGGGIHLDYGVTNSIIQYCYAHNNWGNGFSIYGAVHDNYPRSVSNNTIRYNIAQNNGRGNIYNCNISARGGNDTLYLSYIYNNTIYTTSYNTDTVTAGILTSGHIKDIYIWNNIIVTGDTHSRLLDIGGYFTNLNIQGNLYWNINNSFKLRDNKITYTSFNDWQKSESRELFKDKNVGIFSDPLLKKAGGGKIIGNAYLLDTMISYQTKFSSPAIDNGLNLDSLFNINIGATDYYGNTLKENSKFDIGAYENPYNYIWQDTSK